MYVMCSKQGPARSKCSLNTSPWLFLRLLWGGAWRWCRWRKGTGALSAPLGIQGHAPGRGTRGVDGGRAGPGAQGPGAAQLWDLLQGLTVAPGSSPSPTS